MKLQVTSYKLQVWTLGIFMPVFLFMMVTQAIGAQTTRIDSNKFYASTIITNDTFFTTDPTKLNYQWYLEKIKVPEAWDYIREASNVTVAIVDTGIHATHSELNDGRIVEGYNAIADQVIPANSNSDDNGHGTSVAGIIGATTNNGKGIAGIAWNVKLMPIKVLAADGTGDTATVARGIVWAADHGANIINLSMGGPGFGSDQVLSNAIFYAFNRGVLIVAAAGNDTAVNGQNLDKNPVYPICGDNGQNMILGVASTNINDQKSTFSNYGALCVDISAPGEHILTPVYLPSDPSNNVLIYGSGTSLATPIVAGIAALLKSSNSNFSNTDIRNIIMQSADDIYPFNQNTCLGGSCNGFLGKGRINALTALAPKPITNDSLIRESLTDNIYLVSNNVKRLVTPFVFQQRGLDPNTIVNDINRQLAILPFGKPLMPFEGTMIKSPDSPQVYIIHQELKRPLTYLVFISRGLSFANVKTIPANEVNSLPLGEWYWPPDGTLVLINGDPTVYVMDQGVRRPVTYFVFTQRKLSFKKVVKVSIEDFVHIPGPKDNYWEPPLEGTLVKSSLDSDVYIIENRIRRLLSGAAFAARGLNFNNIKVLPPVEIDVIQPGNPIL